MGKFCQCLTESSALNTIMVGYYSLTFLFIKVLLAKHNLGELYSPFHRFKKGICLFLAKECAQGLVKHLPR